MYYFKTIEEAELTFDKMSAVGREHRVMFIIVKDNRARKNLMDDMATLLQRFPLKRKRDALVVQGTKQNGSQTMHFVTKQEQDNYRLKGVNPDQILDLTGVK